MKMLCKRILSIALCAVMLMGMLPVMHVHAEQHTDRTNTAMNNPYAEISPQDIIVDDDGWSTTYYFTTFEDLKDLCSRSYDQSVEFDYQGNGILEISEDITIPQMATLSSYKRSMRVMEGVTFSVYETSIYFSQGDITVDGSMQFYSSIWNEYDYSTVEAENIIINGELKFDLQDSNYSNVYSLKASNLTVNGSLIFENEGSFLVDNSVIINGFVHFNNAGTIQCNYLNVVGVDNILHPNGLLTFFYSSQEYDSETVEKILAAAADNLSYNFLLTIGSYGSPAATASITKDTTIPRNTGFTIYGDREYSLYGTVNISDGAILTIDGELYADKINIADSSTMQVNGKTVFYSEFAVHGLLINYGLIHGGMSNRICPSFDNDSNYMGTGTIRTISKDSIICTPETYSNWMPGVDISRFEITIAQAFYDEEFGQYYYHCFRDNRCDESHNWRFATCTEPMTCHRCGATFGSPLEHKWTDATCTTAQICSECGAVGESELGHDWDAGVITKLPTVEEDGVRTYTCTRCEATKTEPIPKAEFTEVSGTCGENLTWVLDSDGLLTISGNGDMTVYPSESDVPWHSYRSLIKRVSLPQGMTNIGDYAFADCINLTEVIIPNSVIIIGMSAFNQCTALASVEIGNSVTTIGQAAFAACKSLESVNIPNSVTTIGIGAFGNCNNLVSVDMLYGVKTIGDSAFFNCNKLSAVTLSNDVISIGSRAFIGCSSLVSITIPKSVSSIGSNAFFNCTSLAEIDFRGCAPSFGDTPFRAVTATVYYHGSNSTWTADKRQNYDGNLTWVSVSCTREKIPEVVATCTETGLTDGSACSVCGQVFTAQTVTPALGHNYSYSVMNTPSESATGKLTGACSRCPEIAEITLPKLNTTDYTRTVIRNATCTSSGSARYTWKDTTYGNFFFDVTLPSTDHSYTTTVTAPTCTQQGYTTHSCSGCGDTYTDTFVSALGHNWDVGTVTKEPTETETGIRTFRCTRCPETKTETIPVLPHTHSYTATVTAPNCTQQGYTTYTCSCGDTYKSDYTAALGHNYVDGICTRCGASDSGYEPPKPTVDGVYRIAGAGRIETSIGIANALKETMGVEKFSNIVVASALNFPDALAGSYLAAVKDAPILLTYDAVHAQIAQYIADNLENHGTVYILGGESAVSKKFEYELSARVVHFERVAGTDRFGTNMAILNKANVPTGSTVLVCTALNFADSLSVSATGLPILLVYGKLRPDQKVFLNTVKPGQIHVVGGTGAVSEALLEELKSHAPQVKRVYGQNRHETSATVALEYFPDAKNAVVAYSFNFPDGLCGGPLAYSLGAPLLLTISGDTTPNAYTDKYGINAGYVLGSDTLVNDTSIRSIFHMAAGTAIPLK